MTWKELKDLAIKNNIEDDYEIDVMGLYSKGSKGSIEEVKGEITSTPKGDRKEFLLYINC